MKLFGGRANPIVVGDSNKTTRAEVMEGRHNSIGIPLFGNSQAKTRPARSPYV